MTDTFKIIKNAPPMPFRHAKYPFAEMEINDAFDLTVADRDNIYSAAVKHGKSKGKKFTVRKHGDGYRCQRVA